MKKIILIIPVLIMCSFLFGGKLKSDLESYANLMSAQQHLVEDKNIDNLLDKIAKDDAEAFYDLIEFLQGNYTTSLQSYLTEIKKINPTTIDVKFLHKKFVEAYTALYKGLTAARNLDIATLQAAQSDFDAELPGEYNEFQLGMQIFTIKMKTYAVLSQELFFLASLEQ